MTERELLEAAWHLIEDPRRWTTRAMALDQQGQRTTPDDQSACRWCAIGALERVCTEQQADPESHRAVVERLGDAAEALFGTRVLSHVNDRHGHDAIRRIYQQASAHMAVLEAAAAERKPSEAEQLRGALERCLGRISYLERLLALRGPSAGSDLAMVDAGREAWHARIERDLGGNRLALARPQ